MMTSLDEFGIMSLTIDHFLKPACDGPNMTLLKAENQFFRESIQNLV